MAVDLKGFHDIYINCFVNTDAINNAEAFSVTQSELPEFLTIDTNDREGKIKKSIEKIRAAFCAMGEAKGKALLDNFKASSPQVTNGNNFWRMFDKDVPFEKFEKVQTLFIDRIKALQDECKKYQVQDSIEFLNNVDFFTKFVKKETLSSADTSKATVQILASDFHKVYRACFLENPCYSFTQSMSIQNAFCRLVLIDEKDREGKIVEIIKELRSYFITNDGKENETFLRLQTEANCESFPTAKLFLTLFSPKLPFEKSESVKKICIERINMLQDDIQKLGIKDDVSLTKFLYKPNFFEEEKKVDSSSSSSSVKSSTDIRYETPLFDESKATGINMFSDICLSNQPEDIRQRLLDIREEWLSCVRKGDMITDQLLIVQQQGNKLQGTGSKYTIYMHPVDLKKDPVYPIVNTLKMLVYDEIENNRIHSKEEAEKFVLHQISHYPRFKAVFASKSDVLGTVIMKSFKALAEFDDTFRRNEGRKQDSK